jgi:hypothetical protein
LALSALSTSGVFLLLAMVNAVVQTVVLLGACRRPALT